AAIFLYSAARGFLEKLTLNKRCIRIKWLNNEIDEGIVSGQKPAQRVWLRKSDTSPFFCE
ncbi:hypothetical protein MK904_12620, partial [Loigolactobacillus coryniformis]|uniref:hypothetical protein n=1 Tax=Loigolactobacillus coryniformis TaxID=1610 RepID=UPI0023425127